MPLRRRTLRARPGSLCQRRQHRRRRVRHSVREGRRRTTRRRERFREKQGLRARARRGRGVRLESISLHFAHTSRVIVAAGSVHRLHSDRYRHSARREPACGALQRRLRRRRSHGQLALRQEPRVSRARRHVRHGRSAADVLAGCPEAVHAHVPPCASSVARRRRSKVEVRSFPSWGYDRVLYPGF